MTSDAGGFDLTAAAGSFGVDASRYDRSRPTYPPAMVAAIVERSPGPDVLEVGIGTGILARLLRAAGCRVTGVDVDERMAALADGFPVEVARFEDWDAAGRTFDAVVAGQAWHWVDPAAGAAQAGRVLRPGGLFAAAWNVLQVPTELQAAIGAVHARVLPQLPAAMWNRTPLDLYESMFARAEQGLAAAAAFGPPARLRFDWRRDYTRDEYLDFLPTGGVYTRLEPAVLAELAAGIGAAIDHAGGSFTGDFATVVVTAVRRAPRPGPPRVRPISRPRGAGRATPRRAP